MSAYIVEKIHVLYLIESALAFERGTFRWYWREQWQELPNYNAERAAEVANLLWLENMRSVSHRYPNESSATLPGRPGDIGVIQARDFGPEAKWDHFDPVQVIKACHCFSYQSCETDDWETTEAYAFIQALLNRAMHSLPGYEKAEWGAPATLSSKGRKVVSLSRLARLP